MGVIRALDENGMTGQILTSGIDGTVDALAASRREPPTCR
jgi:ABC-type sugar transport system substrate-binding protein